MAAPTPLTPQTSGTRGVRAASLTAGGLAIEKVAEALLAHYFGGSFLPDSDIPFIAMGVAVGLTGAGTWIAGIVHQLLKRQGLET